MDSEKLAADTVEVLAARLPAIAGDTAPAVADAPIAELYDLVRRWFAANGRLRDFDTFVATPVNSSLVQELLWQAIERDAVFAGSLSSAVSQARTTATPPSSRSVHVNVDGSSNGTFMVAGGKINQNSTSTRTTTIDGTSLAAIAIAAILIATLVAAFILLRH